MSANNRRLTRRSFVRGAAVGAAGFVAAPALADETPAKPPALSKVTSAQVEALFAGAGSHFTEEQKKDVVRLAAGMEKTGAAVTAFPLVENSDPAVIFRAYRKGGK
jgi:hypothetical protein